MRKIIIINGINNHTAGGKSILLNYIKALENIKCNFDFHLFVPKVILEEIPDFIKKGNNKIIPVEKLSFIKNLIWYDFIFSKYISNNKVDYILNLGDIPIKKTNAYQIMYFDWAYAIYPHSIIWKKMPLNQLLYRKLKMFLFKKNLNFVNYFICQTKTVKERLAKHLSFNKTIVIRPPNSLTVSKKEKLNYNFENQNCYLFCLSKYYVHKNLDSLLPLAELIIKEDLNIKIICTIDKFSNDAQEFLNQIKIKKLSKVILNFGILKHEQVNYVFSKIDFFYLPTVLETFGLPYIEAMNNNKPILTSDIDFARDVCGDGAIYFDPFDEKDQLEKIKKIINNKKLQKKLLNQQKNILANDINWEQKMIRTLSIFEKHG